MELSAMEWMMLMTHTCGPGLELSLALTMYCFHSFYVHSYTQDIILS